MARSPARSVARSVSLILRALAILLVAAAPFVPDGERPSERRSLVVVLDDSASVTSGALDRGAGYLAELDALAESAGVEVGVVRVARGARLVRAVGAAPEPSAPPASGDSAAETHERDDDSVGATPVDKTSPTWRDEPSAAGVAGANDPERLGTDLEAGVRLALAALPDEGARHLVLATDGRETRGDVRAAIALARAVGVRVDVVALGEARPDGPSALARLGPVQVTEPRLASGEPAELRATIDAPAGAMVTVQWSRDGRELGQQWVRVGPDGRGEARYVDGSPPGGVHVYAAQIARAYGPGLDYRGEGVDRSPRRAAVHVAGKPRVLVVTLIGDQPTLLVDALRQMDADVEHLPLAEEELDAARLGGVDLVILADLPLAREGEVTVVAGLTQPSQEALIRYVSEEGGGLVVTGGAFGYGPDYAGTPLARILPVQIEDQGRVDDPPVALAVTLDRSGSMGVRTGMHTKLELALEASLAAAAALRPTDHVAIASVDTRTNWHQRLAPVSVLAQNRSAVRAVRAGGGGIYVYTALVDAYRELQPASAPIRHVILFSDTADSEEQFQGCPFGRCGGRMHSAIDLARDAQRAGITTTVVGIGRATDSDTVFLQRLAEAGGGRFYLTAEGADLRRIFVTETRATALSNLREEPTAVRHAEPHAMTAGVGEVPSVSGHVQTRRRATADTVLVTSEGHPILAGWRHGLGHVVALTTDGGGRWSQLWGEWPGAGQLMRQVARFALRREAPTHADARLSLDGLEAVAEVAARDSAPGERPARAEVVYYDAEGRARATEAELVRTSFGRWEVRGALEANEPGEGPDGARRPPSVADSGGAPSAETRRDASETLRPIGPPVYALLRVRDAAGRLMNETLAPQRGALELDAFGPDDTTLDSLAALGEGARDPAPGVALARARHLAEVVPVPEPRWPWPLALAALLVPFDLGVRRLARPKRVMPSDLWGGRPADEEEITREAA